MLGFVCCSVHAVVARLFPHPRGEGREKEVVKASFVKQSRLNLERQHIEAVRTASWNST